MLAIVYNKGAGKQQFLKGVHTDEIIGICRHPAGQIFATGEVGIKPSIIIWYVFLFSFICIFIYILIEFSYVQGFKRYESTSKDCRIS